MTLITTEIHVPGDLRKSTIFFAADRRITAKKKFHTLSRKIFPVKYLNAGIGFFGAATIYPSGTKRSMSQWLHRFIQANSSITNLRDFAHQLKKDVNNAMPRDIKISSPSGFHIAGHNKDNYPEFWFVTNIGGMTNHRYEKFHGYYSATEYFLEREAPSFGFDGKNPVVPQQFAWIYRNGDIRAHVYTWKQLDKIMIDFFSLPDFEKPKSVAGMKEFIRFKMEIIATIYKKYCKVSIIGTPIDVFSISPRKQ